MAVELFGLPGVGKSTLARSLEAHGFKRVRITGRCELCLLNLMYLLRHPLAFFKMLIIVTRVGSTHHRFYRFFMNVFLDVNARIMKGGGRFDIIDQGHAQALLSLSYQPLTEDMVSTYFKLLPRVADTVILRAPDAVRAKRLTARGYGPRDGEEGNETWYRYLNQNAETIAKVLERERSSVILCDSSLPIERVVDAVKSKV